MFRSIFGSRNIQTKLDFAGPSFAEGAARVIDIGSTLDRDRTYRVLYHGTYWNARLASSDVKALKGDVVHVVGRKGLTLLAEPKQ